MHIYIAGIGGAGLGPLAFVAKQLGHHVSGSDLVDSPELADIKNWQPPPILNIGQTARQIAKTHRQKPIDWYVYSSALAWAKPANPELAWVKKEGLKHSKRDEFLNYLLKELGLNLLAVAGTHGKTTTTALIIWSLQQLQVKVSYALGGRLTDQPPAQIVSGSQWFVYEADEFDYNFLAFKPQIALITGLDYDHHEVYKTKKQYLDAFRQFIDQSRLVILSDKDSNLLYPDKKPPAHLLTTNLEAPHPELTLAGRVNRENATLALKALQSLALPAQEDDFLPALNSFPGSWRRFEEIYPNLYSDYAHTPPKIAGCLQIASELQKPVVVVYQPHSNLRQHHIQDEYKNLFGGIKHLYWLPTYLAREDEKLPTLSPKQLLVKLQAGVLAEEAEMDESLELKIQAHLRAGAAVVAMSAGTLDGWLRKTFKA